MRWLLPSLRARAPAAIAATISKVDYHGFVIALCVATVAPFAIVTWAWLRRASRAARWTVLLVQAVVALNVLSHVAAATVFAGYTPGLVTALLVNLPFSVYLFRCAWVEHWDTPARLALLVPAAILVHGLIALLLVTGALGG
jgi:Protein of unknown function with HXXEE motif